jgi:hypothetical protein
LVVKGEFNSDIEKREEIQDPPIHIFFRGEVGCCHHQSTACLKNLIDFACLASAAIQPAHATTFKIQNPHHC